LGVALVVLSKEKIEVVHYLQISSFVQLELNYLFKTAVHAGSHKNGSKTYFLQNDF
jgi:hypothetical protein